MLDERRNLTHSSKDIAPCTAWFGTTAGDRKETGVKSRLNPPQTKRERDRESKSVKEIEKKTILSTLSRISTLVEGKKVLDTRRLVHPAWKKRSPSCC